MRPDKPLPPISTSWEEGRYFDRWMIVHFLSGTAGAFANVFFAFSVRRVYVLGMLLMIAWELVEWARGIRESVENRLLDVVVGVAGISVALWVGQRLGPTGELVAFYLNAAAFSAGSVIGWLAYRRRVRAREGGP